MPADPGEVGDVVTRQVASAHVRERLLPVEALTPGLDVQARVRIRDVADVRDVHLCRVPPGSVAGTHPGVFTL